MEKTPRGKQFRSGISTLSWRCENTFGVRARWLGCCDMGWIDFLVVLGFFFMGEGELSWWVNEWF